MHLQTNGGFQAEIFWGFHVQKNFKSGKKFETGRGLVMMLIMMTMMIYVKEMIMMMY